MNTQTIDRPAIKTAMVTVQYVNPAKSPGKSGSIKDVDGQYFGVRPAMLSSFEPGEAYHVEFTEKVNSGVLYRDIVRIVQPQSQGISPRQADFLTREEIEAQRRPQRTAPMNAHTPAPAPNYRQQTHPADARSMFVCSQLNAMIQTHQIELTVEAVARAIQMLGQAYDLGNGG
jgi:hypothetical protein